MESRPSPLTRLAAKVKLSTVLVLTLFIAVILALLTILTQALPRQRNDSRAFPGYTLVAPLLSLNTYLVDMEGRVVRKWESDYTAGEAAYLLENGHLLRAGQVSGDEQHFTGAGAGGRVQEFTWDGELVWNFKFHNEKQISHHDVAMLPNGNVLLIVWEIKTAEEMIAAGRRSELANGTWLADSVIEIRRTGKTTGEVVWEWHAWDHVIEDRDSSRANYGPAAAHPELIDINFGQDHFPAFSRADLSSKEEAQKKTNLQTLRSLGYVGSPAARANRGVIPDWTHINAVAYNADFDQIMLTVRSFNEFWIIDHSTTTSEAAGHTGGRSGKGGDLLYRWGNPLAYGHGTKGKQQLFAPHDAHWIPRGCPGAGHVLVFNNGVGRSGGDYSSVDEIVLSVDARGRYLREPGTAFGPDEPVWRYTAAQKRRFSAWLMSGSQRLPNGNTLICESTNGMIFEVTPDKRVVWEYDFDGERGSRLVDSGTRTTESGLPPGAVPLSGLRKAVFRAYRYARDYAGLVGKELTPGKTIGELQANEREKKGPAL
jgi:hypothetical protein